jgi:hypothetical protein
MVQQRTLTSIAQEATSKIIAHPPRAIYQLHTVRLAVLPPPPRPAPRPRLGAPCFKYQKFGSTEKQIIFVLKKKWYSHPSSTPSTSGRHKLVRRVRGGHAQERESHRRHAPRTIVSARGSLIAALLPLQGENKLAALAEQEGASLEDRATMAEKILKSPL